MKGETFNRFYFGERSSREFGLTIERKSILDGAKPDMQEYSVPGRAGVQYVWNRRWENVETVYSCYYRDRSGRGPEHMAGRIKNWLLGKPGVYRRLEDSYDLEHYRRAVYSGGLPISEEAGEFARLDICFSCDPFRYLKAGEQPAALQNGSYTADGITCATLDIYNGFEYDSLPVIKLKARTGQWAGVKTRLFMVPPEGGLRLIELYLPGTKGDLWDVELNTPEQRATARRGTAVELLDINFFPVLKPGKTSFFDTDGGDMSGTVIIPNWREL